MDEGDNQIYYIMILYKYNGGQGQGAGVECGGGRGGYERKVICVKEAMVSTSDVSRYVCLVYKKETSV